MKSNKRIKILVCTHKEFVNPKNDLYTTVFSGKAFCETDTAYLGDNTGDNISIKNKSYCELTTLYWAWKNLNDLDTIGLCHYRRYFLFNQSVSFFIKRLPYNFNDFFSLAGSIDFDESLLEKYEFILPEPIKLGKSIYNDYAEHCNKKDFDVLGQVINEMYPECYQSFIHIVHYTEKIAPYNMLLTSKKNYDMYCEWLFPILFEVEKRITISDDVYQARVFGFMAERLLNVYVYHYGIRVKYLPVIKVEETNKDIRVHHFLLKFLVSLVSRLSKRFN
jgi:hypothetical protein